MNLAALGQAVAEAQDAPPDRALALIRPLLRDIGWFADLLAQGCAALATDPMHLPAFRASRSGAARHLVLARTERIWLSATVIDPVEQAGARVHFSGRHMLCRPLNRALYGDGFRLERERAVPTGQRHCAVGDVLELDERHETLRIVPGDGPLMLLRAQVAPDGPVCSRTHDAVTGALVARAEADEGHARALMLLSLLRAQRRADAAAQFDDALDTPLPAQRWAVMREYLALDTGRALPALRAMAHEERDADVRALAVRTLAQIGGVPCPA
ncbi:hypothetical protein EBBID32_12400 [Sphingobium indicum BiD32]|uniref:HEAT repeat domain-containing protein n=1 Tax=Sphingobium indicum BiD32 TaxID=1301087 RepID=N1MIW3_9SPHN|nr:hypothetical protein [Sphingobium indicum]CCW16901.1 hypothetical protein EBBID32_12400 [Sphingobium indicum BiD32]